MITEALKTWLAQYAGIGSCYSPSDIDYKDPDGIDRTGSTGDVLNAFVVAHLVGKDSARIIFNTDYTQLKVINEGNDVTINDVAFAYNNDGDPAGEPKYCIGDCIPAWSCDIPLKGSESDGCGNSRPNSECDPIVIPPGDTERAGVFEFKGPIEGAPTVTLDLSNLKMSQDNTDFHFEMDDIVITSTSPQKIYIALEVRLFTGAMDACPQSGAVFAGMDRVSTTRNPRIKVLDPGEVNEINADFYQPEAIRGVHTVCLLVHGTWVRSALETEISAITG